MLKVGINGQREITPAQKIKMLNVGTILSHQNLKEIKSTCCIKYFVTTCNIYNE